MDDASNCIHISWQAPMEIATRTRNKLKKKLEAARIVTGLTVYIRVGNLYIKKRDGRNYQVDGNAANYA